MNGDTCSLSPTKRVKIIDSKQTRKGYSHELNYIIVLVRNTVWVCPLPDVYKANAITNNPGQAYEETHDFRCSHEVKRFVKEPETFKHSKSNI